MPETRRPAVAGVFFAPVELTPGMEKVNRKVADALDRAGIVVVLLDRDVEQYPRRSKFDLVGIDNVRAGFLQADHLLQLGCRRIDYLPDPCRHRPSTLESPVISLR